MTCVSHLPRTFLEQKNLQSEEPFIVHPGLGVMETCGEPKFSPDEIKCRPQETRNLVGRVEFGRLGDDKWIRNNIGFGVWLWASYHDWR